MPVYVTNWGGGAGIPGMGGNPPGAGSPYHQTELAKKPLANIKPAQVAGAGIIAGISATVVKIPEMMNELKEIDQNEELTAKERSIAKGGAKGDAAGSILGATGGAIAGSLLGAIAAGALTGTAIGTAIPGLGNIAGLLIGGAVGAAGFYFGGKAGRKIGEGIGAATADDDEDSEDGQNQRKRVNHASHRSSASRRTRQQSIPISNLPPQITQTSSNITPQKVELGRADINLKIDLTDDRTTVSADMQNNTMPANFETGSRVRYRRGRV
jgi:hypothetical protein